MMFSGQTRSQASTYYTLTFPTRSEIINELLFGPLLLVYKALVCVLLTSRRWRGDPGACWWAVRAAS